ncbi:hypothetical protein [Pseudidiomarina insulisalsae]|uniref:Uncharacterized protein n=1 Tax=Pseudidiomarina insulisalsae TaxID=575789 RepID=A0A432YMQ6_9GAMM|nr:hypothetical protein [Pseudidiomarina insulisalsae]RUO62271.1 hypothetical protein CWI71_05330 [Pseudidiomarina insulisalsae]
MDKIAQFILCSKLIGFEIPKSQNLTCTWSLRMFFEDRTDVLCCSSDVSTSGSGGWQEYGYLKLNIVDESELDSRDKFNFCALEPIVFSQVAKLVNEEDDVSAECGLLLTTDDGKQVLISTAPAPGAVTVKAEFNSGEYDPEILLEDTIQRPI